MNILSKLPIGMGNQRYEPNFHVEVRGLDRIVEKAVSGLEAGSEGEYSLGRAAMAQSPVQEVGVVLKPSKSGVYGYAVNASKKLMTQVTGFVPSYTLEAVIDVDGSRPYLHADLKALEEAGFRVVGNRKSDALLHIFNDKLFGGGRHAEYSAKPQSATLTYSAKAENHTTEEVGRAITGFAQLLELIVNGAYKAAGKSPPDTTLNFELGEKISRVKGQKIQPVSSQNGGHSDAYAKKADGADEDNFTQALQPAKSDVTFKDIGGYRNVKGQLSDFLLAIKNPQEARRQGYTPSKGILLHGPPGTGKTLFGKALAGELGTEFIYYNASDMLQKYVGDSPKALKAAFEGAQQIADKTKKPVILFIDEIDSAFPQRGTAHDVKIDLVNLFNQYMDGFESRRIPNVWVVGATNRLREMDESATRAGRFEKIEVPLPDLEARTAIFQVTKDSLQREAGTQLFEPAIDYATLAKAAEKFSGADIADVMREARQKAFRQAAVSGQKNVVPTTAAQLEEEIAAYKQQQKRDGKSKNTLGFKKD
ncbi:ATP-binding protein [Candidatus Woesearchaeota archaeon]|nr:ATP-binding protein [Candidatus Woesearchaeota archaeon]